MNKYKMFVIMNSNNYSSPLDQFELRDLLSINFLDYLHISLTNIGLYLLISFFILINFNIFCIASNLTVNK